MKIREAKRGDLEEMVQVGIDCFPNDFASDNRSTKDNARRWFEERYNGNTFARYHVAEVDGKVVGYVFHLMIGGTSGVVQLEQIGVHSNHRKKEIGTKLISESEQFWKEYLQEEFDLSLYKMLLTTSVINDRAQNLYAKNGFKYSTTMKEIYWGHDEEIWIKEF